MKIYTIGHSNRNLEDFVEILKRYKIEVLIDVRRFPTSKFSHFSRKNLEESLRENGICYLYLGDLLGGFRKGGYRKYTETKEFERGIREITKIPKNLALMCSEKFPWKCHRRFIAARLSEKGFEVIHILNEKVWVFKGR